MKRDRKVIITVINNLLDELTLYTANDLFQYSSFFGIPLHFEYENGKWVCKRGE